MRVNPAGKLCRFSIQFVFGVTGKILELLPLSVPLIPARDSQIMSMQVIFAAGMLESLQRFTGRMGYEKLLAPAQIIVEMILELVFEQLFNFLFIVHRWLTTKYTGV